jgi:hypothetical protein
MPYGRSSGCVARRCRRKRLVREPVASSRRDACLHAQQDRVASIGYAAWGAQVSLGTSSRRAEVEGPIERSDDAQSLGNASIANGSGDGNGTLDPTASEQKKRVHARLTCPWQSRIEAIPRLLSWKNMVGVSRACIKRPGAIREVGRNLHRGRFEPLHITLSRYR